MAFAQNVTLGPGSESLSSHTWEIVVMLAGAFAFGFLLSHLFGQLKLRKLDEELELEQKHRRTLEHDFDQVRAEHSAFGSRVNTLEGELNGLRSQLADRVKERDESAAKRAALELQLSELQDEDRTNKHDVNLARVRTELSAALANRDALHAECERLRAQLQALTNAR